MWAPLPAVVHSLAGSGQAAGAWGARAACVCAQHAYARRAEKQRGSLLGAAVGRVLYCTGGPGPGRAERGAEEYIAAHGGAWGRRCRPVRGSMPHVHGTGACMALARVHACMAMCAAPSSASAAAVSIGPTRTIRIRGRTAWGPRAAGCFQAA